MALLNQCVTINCKKTNKQKIKNKKNKQEHKSEKVLG